MTLTRRTILQTGAAALLTPMFARRSWAASTMEIGNIRVDTLSDGHLVLPMSFVTDHDGAREIMATYGMTGDAVEPPCNVTLLRDGTNTVLFDVGAGPDFMPTAGKLSEAMDALGITADDVTHVVFTHAHPDHLWGVLDDFDEPLFANATHMMGKQEWDYWIDPETASTIGAGRESFAAGAIRRLQLLEDRIVTFDPEMEILPGINAVASYGHTPGHMSFEVRQGNDACMIVGDAIGNHHLAFAQPLWASGSDQDPELGSKTRADLLARLTDQQMPMIGYHLPDGGIGRVERDGESYRFGGV